jgi:hypothetical protein
MKSIALRTEAKERTRVRFVGRLLLGCILTGAAGTKLHAQIPAADVRPEIVRSVQALPLHNTADDQSSWIIEQDVPRIPKIRGLDPQLPPHIERRLSYAFDLAQRGATYSANAEFRAVLGMCALELDAREGGTARREALRQGWIALDEADDFGGDQAEWLSAGDVRVVAAGHTTPSLKSASQSHVDSIHALQAYYAFAGERLTYSCRDLPGASLAFYGLARTCVESGPRIKHAAGKSALLQRVALAIAPENVLAGNELGVLLAQHGHLVEAESVFRQCVAIDERPETWRNLAVVCARRGDHLASQAASEAGEALAASKRRNAMSANGAVATTAAAVADEPNGEREKGRFFNLSLPRLKSPFRR